MHDQIKLWKLAAQEFDARHRQVEPSHLTGATPCDEFDVGQLIEHAIGTQIWFGGLIGGEASETATWSEARAEMAEALAAPNVLDGTIELPGLGELPKSSALAIATNDLLIHSWDLARSIGADETLPEASIDAAVIGLKAFPPEVKDSMFSEFEAAADASPQAKMLALAGRTL